VELGGVNMYSEQHYLSRSRVAQELAALPENTARKKAYLALAAHWKKLAEAAAMRFPNPPRTMRR
jgi:hypothetical protein